MSCWHAASGYPWQDRFAMRGIFTAVMGWAVTNVACWMLV